MANSWWLNQLCRHNGSSKRTWQFRAPGWWTHPGARRALCLERAWKSHTHFPYLARCISSTWLLLNDIFHNKWGIESELLLKILWAIPSIVNYQTLEGIGGDLWFIGKTLVRSTRGLALWLAYKWGSLLWDKPLTCGVCTNTRYLSVWLKRIAGHPNWCPQRTGEFPGMENPLILCQKL